MTPPPRASAARALPLVLVALGLLAAGGGAAAIAWTSTSTLTTTVGAPPVEWEVGSGGQKARYFSSFGLSANKTLVTGGVSGKNGADMVVKDVLRVVNRDTVPRTVTLSATQVTNARVEAFAWTVRDDATTVGVLDHRASAPSLTFTLPAGATRTLDLRLDLADGSGLHDTTFGFDLRVRVAP